MPQAMIGRRLAQVAKLTVPSH